MRRLLSPSLNTKLILVKKTTSSSAKLQAASGLTCLRLVCRRSFGTSLTLRSGRTPINEEELTPIDPNDLYEGDYQLQQLKQQNEDEMQEEDESDDGISFLASTEATGVIQESLTKAKALFEESKFEEAASLLQELLQKAPESTEPITAEVNASLHNNLGVIYEKVDNFELAIKHLTTAMEYMPKDPSICTNIGIIFHRLKKYKQAAEMYKRALSIDPNLVPTMYRLGMIYVRDNNKIGEAISLFQQCIDLEPSFSRPYAELVPILADMEDDGGIQQAIELSTKLIRNAEKDDAMGYILKAYALSRASKFYEAIKIYDQMFKSFPNYTPNADIYLNIAVLHEAVGNAQEAYEFCEKALKLDPENPNAGFMMSKMLTAQGKDNEAEVLLQKIIKADPTNPVPYGSYIQLLAKKGLFRAANAMLDVAEEKYPKLAEPFKLYRNFVDKSERERSEKI